MQTRLPLNRVRLDGGTQTRAGTNQEVVSEYADAIQSGVQFPPVIVFHDGSDYWLADGFHRWRAHKFLDLREIEAEVRQGTQRDAVLFSVGANASHGLRRTNADKRRAVETLLRDEEWGRNSDNWIAKQAHVSQPFVSKMRQELAPSLKTVISERRTSDGRTMQTGNIGQRPAAPACPPGVDSHPTPPPSATQRLAQNLARDTYEARPQVVSPDAPASRDDGARAVQPEPVPPPPPFKPEPEPVQASTPYIPFEEPEREPVPFDPLNPPKELNDLHNALARLLRFDREGRHLLANPTAHALGIRGLARHAREMLDEWLDERSEKEAKTITIDALN